MVFLDFEGHADATEYDENLYNDFIKDKYEALFFFGFKHLDENSTDSIKFIHAISAKIIEKIAHKSDIEFTRDQSDIILSDDEISKVLLSLPFSLGMENVNENWLRDVFDELANVFRKHIGSYDGTVQEFLSEQDSSLTVMGRVFFHLVENKNNEFPFAFLATYSTGSGNRKVNHIPLKNALLEYKGQTDKLLELLSTVSRVVQKSDLISGLVESGELFSPLKFTAHEAYIFLKEIPLYEESGIICRIPDWWRKKQSRVGVSLNIGEKGEAIVGQKAILSFNPKISLGGEELSDEEIRFLLAQSEGLVLLKGKWVEADHDKLKQALLMMEKAKSHADTGFIGIFDALRMETDISQIFESPGVEIEISHGEWISSVFEKLRKPSLIQNISSGENFKAILRHYQQTGLDWLNFMIEMGFGACLADDMGLGKTIQIIGLLEYLRISQKQTKPSLLVVPASIIGNWKAELEKFAPLLKFKILHGNTGYETDPDTNLYITTYTMIARMEQLKDTDWNLLILDEAQAIKNPGTKQTKAVKALKSDSRIAMTGTPIENRLTDLWSLFDFLNSGLLGNTKEFKAFAKRLNEHGNEYGKLRSVISPFILRRLKTDKSIISDLPDKIEMKSYTQLTKKQVVLYQRFVDDLEKKLYNSEGIDRKGLILGSIIRLKQICNHPDHFLGSSEYNEIHSGKFGQLRRICEEIYEKRERVLVFTQFKEIIDPLNDLLENIFERKGLILHGSTAVKKRQELVEEFCGESYVPYMVLSLKAGGVVLI
ncbi:snf2/rad54 helicase family [Holotrichia oblita]|nr:snf2/rad54 helicase family [Holotrichia oblita]